MKTILSIIFLFLTQDQTLLQKIKADPDYIVYMDTQVKIRDGFRSKRFVFPPNAGDLMKNQKSVDEQVWINTYKKAGMVNPEEFVKLHFLSITSMGKVILKFRPEILKLSPEKQTEIFTELATLPRTPIPDPF